MSHGDYKAFFAAACAGDVELLLLDHGASPTLRSPLEGATPLQAASAAGLDRVVARLTRAAPAT